MLTYLHSVSLTYKLFLHGELPSHDPSIRVFNICAPNGCLRHLKLIQLDVELYNPSIWAFNSKEAKWKHSLHITWGRVKSENYQAHI